MHPYWHWHRGPSRLWWFVIGAVTATWWHKSKEYHRYKLEHCSRHRIPSEAYPGPPTTPTPGPHPSSSNLQAVALQEKALAMPPTMQPNPASSWGWGSNSSWSQSPLPTSPPIDRWEESRVRTEELTNKASEKVVSLYGLHLSSDLLNILHFPVYGDVRSNN